MAARRIGVFDSGVGGKSVAQAIQAAYPEDTVIFQHDTADHFPYANKTPEQLLGFVTPVLQQMINDGCEVIVIACNTVTTTIISDLRSASSVPLVAIEPMVKPAAEQTKSGIIAVCATPTTLKSTRYAELKAEFAPGKTVLEPDCADWSSLIEANQITRDRLNREIIPVLDAGADVVVLACTHYHWIEEDILELTKGKAVVLQPEQATIKQLATVLEQLQ